MSDISHEQTRRNFIKTASIGAIGALSTSALAGCSTQSSNVTSSTTETISEEASIVTTGCFQGHGIGAKGDVSVTLVIEDGAITSMTSGENFESDGRGDKAFSLLSQQILDTQSFNVDVISGATLSSMGYISAVKEAIENAGMTDTFDIPVSPAQSEHGDEEYDVVIIGAGGAGLMAAMTLMYPNYDGVKSDINAIVLEKLDIVGGSTSLSYGGCAVGDGLQANDVMGHHVSPDEMVDLLMKRNSDGVNEPLAHSIFTDSPDTISKISSFGGPYATSYTGSVKNYSGYTYLQMDANLNFILSDVDKADLGSFTNQGGYALANYLDTKVRQSGCEIRTGAKAEDLIMENGAIAGVHVVEGSSEYDLRAKKVIMASGGFTYSSEYMEELTGDMIPTFTPWCGPGSTGDAFTMTENLGATRVGKGALVYFSLDPQLGMFSDLNNTYRKRNEIIVSEEGVRIADESQDEYYIAYHISQAPNGHAFAIIDSDNPGVEVFEKWIDRGKVFKADTIDELAELCGIDSSSLNETIASYNNAYDSGETPEFDTPLESMYPVVSGPFYAGEISVCVIGSLVGLKVNEYCQILGTDETPIEGLYGVGEVCLGGNILSSYYSGGCSIATALNTGRISAEHIMDNLS